MTAADLIIVATLAVSGLLAMMRGFTQELLSIIAFVAAALVALLVLPVLKPLVGDALPQGWAGTAIIVGVTFFVALIPLWYLSDRLGQRVRGSAVGALDRTDRTFGFGFGALRGLFILAIAYLLFQVFTGSERNLPDWVQEARLLPLVKSSADLLLTVLPEDNVVGRSG
jgi:membrane protein required for colicin V production